MEQYRQNNNGYYPQRKNNSNVKLVRILLVLFCMFFIGIGALLIFLGTKQSEEEKEKEEYYVDVDAIITDITVTGTGDDRTHSVFIEYIYEGKKYEGRLNYYSSTMDIGDVVEMLCDPSNPREYMAKGFLGKTSGILYIVGGIFAGVALFIMIIGLVVTGIASKTSKQREGYNRESTYTNGQEMGDYSDVYMDSYTQGGYDGCENRDFDGYTTNYAKVDYDNYSNR